MQASTNTKLWQFKVIKVDVCGRLNFANLLKIGCLEQGKSDLHDGDS